MNAIDSYLPIIPSLITLLLSLISLGLAHYLLLGRHASLGSEARLPRQVLLFFLTAVAVILVVVTSPLAETTRNQILGIIGLGFSGVIAFSSTAFVTNFMAAITLRVTRPFVVGDFVTVGEHFGKVSERGLFDTEIQTESRELISIPNSLFILTPVKVTHHSGVIISTTLSLGYDVHHARIEALLLLAASRAGLTDPYVHILSLNDFTVSYRVSGLLAEVKTLLTSRSKLNQEVLDCLHRRGIEIVSPTFTRHINQPMEHKQIPVEQYVQGASESVAAEDIAFEKANRAADLEALQLSIEQEIHDLKAHIVGAGEDEKRKLEALLLRLQGELTRLAEQAKNQPP